MCLYWRFPDDGDLSLKHGGSFRFMDNLTIILYAYVFASALHGVNDINFRSLFIL